MYKLLMSYFLGISHTKNHSNQLIFDRVIGKIKSGLFLGHSVELLSTSTAFLADNSYMTVVALLHSAFKPTSNALHSRQSFWMDCKLSICNFFSRQYDQICAP